MWCCFRAGNFWLMFFWFVLGPFGWDVLIVLIRCNIRWPALIWCMVMVAWSPMSVIYIYVMSVFIFSYYDLMITKSWGFVTPGTPATSMVLAAEVAKARVEHVARLNVFNFQPWKNSICWNLKYLFFLLSFYFWCTENHISSYNYVCMEVCKHRC